MLTVTPRDVTWLAVSFDEHFYFCIDFSNWPFTQCVPGISDSTVSYNSMFHHTKFEPNRFTNFTMSVNVKVFWTHSVKQQLFPLCQ